ncbi:alkaline phosphatase D family protein [Undibacterium sp. CY18W]|uniref:Alkaline phosphatase D family protein n=1 Tax=Undibacterium hunanense TaxID=2762292 RepID=A0ABR6ZZ46_9BURK|nr:alkaline phosphatase D family protein [Undibacterium hunanense]MBC3921148.1 alkaline phosphatase D family protein [Undibacterium hunanense]
MKLSRRLFLQHSLQFTTLAAMAQAFPSFAAERSTVYPFSLGVASGSPRADSVVLWTRLLPDPLNAQALPAIVYKLRWEIAEDDNFRRIVNKGEAHALPELAHSVHVDATGLQPDRWYWYRFMLGDAVSPVARTRTAPALDAVVSNLRLAVASCQHWEFGEYAAHRHIAAANPDLIAFLGDYIYEWGPYDTRHPGKPRKREQESFTLADYRSRYAQYKTDPQLQAAHHVAPWIVTWDDHEVSNDYGNDRDERLDVNFLLRRAAAYQAFYEHMPVRLHASVSEAERFSNMRIYDRYDWGRLARFHVLDDRQYRSHHACPKPGRGGSNSVSNAECSERMDPNRTMLGQEQEKWLGRGFASSTAKWNILTQQTLMAQSSQTAVTQEGDGKFWTDGWDGYPVARQRLFDDIQKHKPANPVVISGDVHTFYAANLKRDFYTRSSPSNPVLATEFCGTSVTSSSRPQERTDQYVAQNPHIKYGRSDKRGFMLMEISQTRMLTHFLGLDDVAKADSGIATLSSFIVDEGRTGLSFA